MGCDIHLVVQRRENGKWVDTLVEEWADLPGHMYRDIDDDIWEARSYYTFSLLAGVRGSNWPEIISDRRGFPADFDVVDGEDHPVNGSHGLVENTKWMGDHNHGWATLAELLSAEARWSEDEEWEWTMLPQWLPRLRKLGDPDDVRIVFGFDN